MAITNDDFSAEELEQVLTKKPELLQLITPALTKRELTVMDKAGKTTYDSQLETAVIGRKTGEIAQLVEKAVKDISGIEPIVNGADKEKWNVLYERALKTSVEDAKTAKEELTALKSKSTLSEAERDRMDQLTGMVKTQKTEIQTLKDQHATEIGRMKISAKILSEVSPIMGKRNALIPERAFNIAHEDTINIMAKAAIIDESNNKIIYKIDGKSVIDDAGNYKTTPVVYSELMKEFLEENKIQTGAGGQGSGQGGDTDLPATINTQQKLSAWLISKGKISGTKEYNDLWTKHKGGTLPRQ